MNDIILAIIELLGGMGAFLLGFKVLSESIEKLASAGLKRLFNKTSKNRFIGVGIGALVTAIIQSSSATTVMIVGFVNAGVMNLFQATTMIMGANIGTTITAQIVALQSFDIVAYVAILAFIGIFMNMLGKKDRTKTIGLSLAGLGLVFISLEIMSGSMEAMKESDKVINLLQSVNNPFLLVLIGVGITAIVQSSSAVTTILISMVGAGITIGSDPNAVLFVVLGTNIGTCVTALISSIGASVNARRASLIHLLFNIFGSILFIIILLIWKDFMVDTLQKWFSSPTTQIAMFHTLFNVVSTILFIGFVNVFVKLSELIIKDKKEDKKTTYLDERFIHTPGIAINQAIKETVLLGEFAMNTLDLAITKFIEKSILSEEEIKQKISDIEIVNREIITFLVKVSSQDVTIEDEKTISALHHSLNDFIREAEIADNMVKYTRSAINNNIEFSDSVYESIKKLQGMLKEQFANIKKIMLYSDYSLIGKVKDLEDEIDNMRSSLINGHIKRLEEGTCKPQSSGIFINLISNLERAGDHLDYIADTMVNSLK
ncbi:MAG: Na/Pi cotransporter family protein [Bacilli bacterium]|jgi:Na/Pi-cotransporter II-like protein|nr:Na/Pi cotransporter family protein [Staphylococcus sp.]